MPVLRSTRYKKNLRPEVCQGAMLHKHIQPQAIYHAWSADENHHHAHFHFAKDLLHPYNCQCWGQLNPQNPGAGKGLANSGNYNMKANKLDKKKDH